MSIQKIIKNRFLNQLLNLKFPYNGRGELKLINIILGSDSSKSDWGDISRLNALSLLSNKISMSIDKRTSIITLRVTTNEFFLENWLLD